MKILIGCDVDPDLPALLDAPPGCDIWRGLDRISELIQRASLPVMTWLVRADESVRFASGDFASGYLAGRGLWEGLRERGHELGWHMHLLSRSPTGFFRFDPRPPWLEEACGALSRFFPVLASRTGWDYGSDFLLARLDALGVRVDFSALPGNRIWFKAGARVNVDWLGCGPGPYHPGRGDYQRPGDDSLGLLEVPVAQFPNGAWGMLRRRLWRLGHGCFSTVGLGNKTRAMTEVWPVLPRLDSSVLAFPFHPQDLTSSGIENFLNNVKTLRSLPEAEFVTAAQLTASR